MAKRKKRSDVMRPKFPTLKKRGRKRGLHIKPVKINFKKIGRTLKGTGRKVGRTLKKTAKKYKKSLAKSRKSIQKVKRAVRKGAKWADEKGFKYAEMAAAASGDPRIVSGVSSAHRALGVARKIDKASQGIRKRLPRKVKAYIP